MSVSTVKGLSKTDGSVILGDAHLAQSITDILTTPIGSRVMRRTYGSRLPRLIDAPMNAAVKADIVAAIAEAIAAWEPRFALSSVAILAAGAGHLEVNLQGQYLGAAKAISVSLGGDA